VRTITAEADTLQRTISDQHPLQGASRGSASTIANANGIWNSEIRYSDFGEICWKIGVKPSNYRYRGAPCKSTGQLDMQSSIGLETIFTIRGKVTFPWRRKVGMRVKSANHTPVGFESPWQACMRIENASPCGLTL
jgi:hypothetical protein